MTATSTGYLAGCSFAAVVLVGVSCGGPTIVPGTPRFVAPPNIHGSETSIAFSPGSPGLLGSPVAPTTIVQFNDYKGGSLFGWSWTADGTNWNYCNASLSDCGGPGIQVPKATNQSNWRSDPAIAAAPD